MNNTLEVLNRLSHYLPSQGPLKDFIHHNTLHHFQSLAFEDGVEVASKIYGANRFLSLDEYYKYIDDGKIDLNIFKKLLFETFSDQTIASQYLEIVEKRINLAITSKNNSQSLKSQWNLIIGEDLNQLVNPILFKLISQYLDQGISFWKMPNSNVETFYNCVKLLVQNSFFPIFSISNKEIKKIFEVPAEIAIDLCLEKLIGKDHEYKLKEKYLWETLFEHRGWAGLIQQLEQNSELLLLKRKIRLIDFVAIKLILEVSTLSSILGNNFKSIKTLDSELLPHNLKNNSLESLLHKALEETYYSECLNKFKNSKTNESLSNAKVQAIFCIDDRECSIRRHLEESSSQIETYGTAGFFGVDAMFLKEDELYPIKSCPVPN